MSKYLEFFLLVAILLQTLDTQDITAPLTPLTLIVPSFIPLGGWLIFRDPKSHKFLSKLPDSSDIAIKTPSQWGEVTWIVFPNGLLHSYQNETLLLTENILEWRWISSEDGNRVILKDVKNILGVEIDVGVW
eukprot:CAMPEP_0114972380 /NCGR_PEP_ID=MMETSP0216-20121206/360_1 /TAXON_ID=223996 /ORGANISM="Protocruzia adherens, Strain Boccale" /LENGTH=131 /DNA_ID=CAMNT_0002332741 /DNA_START=238 /DNA_END=630 /DNA_ORIENTATION=+